MNKKIKLPTREEIIELIVEVESTSDTRKWYDTVGKNKEEIAIMRNNNFKRIGEIADAVIRILK
jgi:hypothetical protein